MHRDIKPENILLQDGHALVADFGIARAIDPGVQNRLTGTGIRLGTPSYMSPEQAAGGQTLDARTDVFSLGCVLYEMLTGGPPFTGADAAAILAQVLTAQPAPVGSARPAAASLEPVLARALARVPADRFASAREFATALDAVPAHRDNQSGGFRPGCAVSATRWLLCSRLVVTIWAVWLPPMARHRDRPRSPFSRSRITVSPTTSTSPPE